MKNKMHILTTSALLTIAHVAYASSATWNLEPTSNDWNTAANWTPTTVPNGPADIATFDVSNITNISLAATITTDVDSIVFNADASAYLITTELAGLNFNGAGIINNSGNTQQFFIPADSSGYGTEFFGSASVGSNVAFALEGGDSGQIGGLINFWEDSSAGDASFTLLGPGSVGYSGGARTLFFDNATAGNATFLCDGSYGDSGGIAAYTWFYDNAGAGNAILIADGANINGGFGGAIVFSGDSSAEDATIITYDKNQAGGRVNFSENATGGNARLELSNLGLLTITVTTSSLSFGSIEGSGDVLVIGSQSLIIGSNNLSTIYYGKIYGHAGSLTKVGRGTLTLTASNEYSGGTVVAGRGGSLLVNTLVYSGTGSGPVQVNSGTLGGNGTIAGQVTVGTGSGDGAMLSPGGTKRDPGVLTVQNGLTFNSDGVFVWKLNVRKGEVSRVIASGVSIASNAAFSPVELNPKKLPISAATTVIINTATTPISGTFTNLADGGTITVGSNTFQANYEGGDGNDLTLTVIGP